LYLCAGMIAFHVLRHSLMMCLVDKNINVQAPACS
jgi:hypothetical protein